MKSRNTLIALLTVVMIGLGSSGQALAGERGHFSYRGDSHSHSYKRGHEKHRPRYQDRHYKRPYKSHRYDDRHYYSGRHYKPRHYKPRYYPDRYYGAYGLGVITGILLNDYH